MVEFSKLGSRAGEKGYPIIDEDWEDLPEKKRRVIRALIKHPERRQDEIAEIAGCDSSHVHKVVHSLPPEQLRKYKGESVQEVGIGVEPQNLDVDDSGLISVTAPIEMLVQVSIPKQDLETATSAAISKDAILTGVEALDAGDDDDGKQSRKGVTGKSCN